MRCYVPPNEWTADRVTLDADETHHLVHVLRADVGQRVDVFDGAGREADAEVLEIARGCVRLKLVQQRLAPKPAVALTLIQAIPREQKMDAILQKATELGASKIIPVIGDHCVVRLRDGDEAKHGRWEKIVLNSAKQSGAAWLPDLRPVQSLIDALKQLPPFDVLLAGSLEPDARPFRDVLAEVRALNPKSIAFLVGPEGDFSGRELAAARQAGARPVTFGPLVLRVETAALYALSVLKYEFNT